MKNRVLSGRFQGRAIGMRHGKPAILLGWGQQLLLTADSVTHLQVLYIHWRPSASSGWGRGLAGSLLGRTMQLSAIQSAHRIPTFHCRLQFSDGSVALIRVDEGLFLALSAELPVY